MASVPDIAHGMQSIAPAAQIKYEKILYGLPCAGCGSYYASDLPACPTCQSAERVPAVPRGKVRL